MRRPCRLPAPPFPLLAAALAALLLVAPAPARDLDAQALYRKVKDSVVIVYKKQLGGLDCYFGGSGFVVGDGTVAVTNHHVTQGVTTAMRLVTLDGRIVENVVPLRYSADDDLALLRLPERLPPLELYPKKVEVGLPVAVLGNPEGFMGTLATGVVSGVRTYPEWPAGGRIQTTVPSSPGSSGSPLMDAAGRVVGVICSGYRDEQNLNFAVPVEKLRELLGRDLSPAADGGTGGAAPEPDRSLEIRTAPDGAITIIQKRRPAQ